MKYALSWLQNNGNWKTTHQSNYIMKYTSEIKYTKELYEGKFLVKFKRIDLYKRKYSIVMSKWITGNENVVHFVEVLLKKCSGKVNILSKIQRFAFNWHHMYLIHPVLNINDGMISPTCILVCLDKISATIT